MVTSLNRKLKVLYSFPHKIGASRICHTAWQQVAGVSAAGAEITVFPGAVFKPLPSNIKVRPTLACGRFRIPYKLLGTVRACALHDLIVSLRLEHMRDQVDVIHTWPLGARRTLQTAARLGIPTVLERPNTHTRFGYEIVNAESKRLGIILPHRDEHKYNAKILSIEEEEYNLADYILCPSDFVVRSFLRYGFKQEKLLRHIYGFDHNKFWPNLNAPVDRKFTLLFVGVCSVVKGLHFALEAWVNSIASTNGTFLIVGDFLPAYAEKLAKFLSHPSVKVLGFRKDIPEIMRQSHALVLPSLTEGFGLVVAEAMGSGCVPLVSESCTDICKHMVNSLVHPVGDVELLSRQISTLSSDSLLLAKLRAGALRNVPEFTWDAAGRRLLQAYERAAGQITNRHGQ